MIDLRNPPTDLASPPSSTPRRRRPMRLLVTTTIVLVGLILVVLGMTRFWPDAGSQGTVAVTSTVQESAVSAGGDEVLVPVATGLTDVSEIAADVVDSVVTVEVTAQFRGREELVATGSGVILDDAGTIVTNAHVVESASSVEVVLADGSTFAANVVGSDPGNDLAVLDIDATGLDPIELGSTEDLAVGDPVIAVGYPLALEGGPSVSTGIVSALDRVLEDADVSLTGIIQTDAAITEGSSGGALLDGQGHLVGITTAVGVSSVGIEGIGFVIPVETITSVVGSLIGV